MPWLTPTTESDRFVLPKRVKYTSQPTKAGSGKKLLVPPKAGCWLPMVNLFRPGMPVRRAGIRSRILPMAIARQVFGILLLIGRIGQMERGKKSGAVPGFIRVGIKPVRVKLVVAAIPG